MSDQIPFHIQEEIMKRLPVKSLVQFRSVSKAWKSLIESSDFIAAQNLHRHNQPQHLIVSFEFPAFEEDCVIFSRCYIDDDNFPLQISLPTLPLSVNQLTLSTIVGSSHGLVCLYGSHPDFSSKMAVVCNPSIRKSFVVAVPGLPFVLHEPSVGFGVCPVTRDPKIVAIIHSSEVMVYTLKSGEWRSVFGNLPTIGTRDLFCSVVTDRFIYWRAESQTRKMVMSFDVTSENFEAIDLPDSLAHHGPREMKLSKLRESLALFQYGDGFNFFNFTTVWIMEDGAQRSFTRLFTITTPHECIVGFRKSGVPIMQVTDDDDEQPDKLVVYEPNSEHDNVLQICPPYHFFFMNSYTETLLLLGRSDCSSY